MFPFCFNKFLKLAILFVLDLNPASEERIRRHQLEAEDHLSRVLYELCSMIIHTLKFPPLPFPFPAPYPYSCAPTASSSSSSSSSSSTSPQPKSHPRWTWTTLSATCSQDSPAAFASLFMGISLALMLFGSVAFLVGLLLLPCVTILVLVFYAAALVSDLSMLGRCILGFTTLRKNDAPYEANKLPKH